MSSGRGNNNNYYKTEEENVNEQSSEDETNYQSYYEDKTEEETKVKEHDYDNKKIKQPKRTLKIFKKNLPTNAATTEIKLENTKRVQYYVLFLS